MTIEAQLDNIVLETAKRWHAVRRSSNTVKVQRAMSAVCRLTFTSSLIVTQVLRRFLVQANMREKVDIRALQCQVVPADIPRLIDIMRANIDQLKLVLELAGRRQGGTRNLEELIVEFIALGEKDLNVLYRVEKASSVA